MTNLTVNIVGGGIGGLTAALAFADRGASVSVFEQAPKFSEVGAGVQITPNGARVLEALNLNLPGVESQAVLPIDGVSGTVLSRFDLSKQTPRYRFMHRADLISTLSTACQARGVSLLTDKRMTKAEISWAQERSDLLVFADGIRSIGRDLLNAPQNPFFTGQVAWRAIVMQRMPAEAHIAMGAGKHLVAYPLDENRVNLVAVQERAEWAEEGWSIGDNPENLRAAFSDFSPEYKALLAKVETTFLWGLFRHDVAQRWCKGNAALLGDAAHPTLPFLAQGANLAIEDAFVMARMVSEFGVGDGLERYQTIRTPRVERAITVANRNATNYHAQGLRRHVSHLGLRAIGKMAPNAFINRLNWLYEHDVTA